MTRSNPHRRAGRRLPWWIRRAVRLWARCIAAIGGRSDRSLPRTWLTPADELPAPPPPDERRCGWFDSSLDLREGLAVSEHAADDPVTAQLPVMAWVQLQLSGWQPQLEAPAA